MGEIVNTVIDFFKDIVTDQGKGLIVSAVKGIAIKFKSDRDWKKLFVDSGKKFIDSEEVAGRFFDELSDILSKKSMKELARELRNDPGYGIEEKALGFLVRLMGKYGIPHDRAIVYSKDLLIVILESIRASYPGRYDRYFQSDWRKADILNSKETLEKLDAVSKQLEEYKNQGLSILSSDDIDHYLHEKFTPTFFGISFFEVDDDQFRAYLFEHKSDERIYIKCKCKEEAIYCTINELWHKKEARPVFIVKNQESWDTLRKIRNSGNIYIPDFWADEIIAIPNNTNIFIMQENFPLFSKDFVELRPRTTRTLTSCLERSGLEITEATELVSKNHGLFTLMKKKLIKGVYQKNPEWYGKIPDSIVKTCLLICSWRDNLGDKLIIEELSGYKYDEFITEVQKYSRSDDPFAVVFLHYGERFYSLANAEDSWLYCKEIIDETSWKKFIDIFTYVMTQDENLLSYKSIVDKTRAEMDGEKLEWSGLIRSGMVHALMIKTYYINDENCQPFVNNLVSSILSTINDEQRWRYISNYFKELCELAPEVVLDRLLQEFDEPTGMIQLFAEKPDDMLWEPHYYFNILWGLEQLLLQREFAHKAFEVVLRLDDLDIKYNSNSPREIIRTVLCIWGNFSAFDSAKHKMEAANKVFDLDKNAWNIIYSVLPDNQQTVFGSFNKPLYREYVTRRNVSSNDYYDVLNGYVSLLVRNALFDVDRWIKLLDVMGQLREESFSQICANLLESIGQMDDLKTIRVKDSIREIIHKHRFFNNASWAMSEDRIVRFEELLNKISVKTPEYEYAYYFNYPEMDFPLLQPNAFNDEEYMQKNEQIAKNIIKEKMKEFKERNLNLSVLGSCCAGRERMEGTRYVQSYLGWYLALYWDDKGFDKEVFSSLLKVQKSGAFACEYFRVLGKKTAGHFNDALEIAKAEGCDVSILVRLYQVEAQFAEGLPSVDQADEEIKKAFWSQYVFGIYKDVEWALSECQKHGTYGSYARLLYYLNEQNHFDSEFLYNHVIKILSMASSSHDDMDMA